MGILNFAVLEEVILWVSLHFQHFQRGCTPSNEGDAGGDTQGDTLWQCGNIAFCSAGGGYSLGFATFQHFQHGCTPYKLVTKVTSVEASD